jgi:hypothetical protein
MYPSSTIRNKPLGEVRLRGFIFLHALCLQQSLRAFRGLQSQLHTFVRNVINGARAA